MSGERGVHPSFVVPTHSAADKENEHLNTKLFPVTPGHKPLKKGKALTTGRVKKTKPASLLHEKPIRVPLSSKKTNATTPPPADGLHHSHHVLNPFGWCDVSLHENDHHSAHDVASSAIKAKGVETDDHNSLLYHVGGPISSQHAARVRTPHGKAMARTPLIPKRMGVDGTYKTPSKELLRSTACSRGHEHHPHHQHQPFPLKAAAAVTTGGKTKKTREISRNRCEQLHHEEEDIALRVPHVTFRGEDVVGDTTFDAEFGADDDDVSALSIQLDCHATYSHGKHCIDDIPDCIDPLPDTNDCDDETAGSLMGELELCHLGNEGNGAARDKMREGTKNPIAVTLHLEHFVRQNGKTQMRHSVVVDEELPLFTKSGSSPGVNVAGDCAIRPSVRHGGR